MLTVVVSGAARKAGKTRAVCDIIAATREASWVAVKISPHGHGDPLDRPIFSEEPSGDTGRYLAAGAARAIWLRAKPEDLRDALDMLPAGNRILESNAVVEHVTPDLLIYVEAAGAKPSAELPRRRSDMQVSGELSAADLERIRAALASAWHRVSSPVVKR